MAPIDPIVQLLQATLPEEVLSASRQHLGWLTSGQYEAILACEDARSLFKNGHAVESCLDEAGSWLDRLFSKVNSSLAKKTKASLPTVYVCIGYAALLAFIQATVTGPPLTFHPTSYLLDKGAGDQSDWQKDLLKSLSCDGVAAYSLVPHIELLCVAETILSSPILLKNVLPTRWLKARTAFVHQRLLSEISSSLETTIKQDFAMAEQSLQSDSTSAGKQVQVYLQLERAVVQLYYGQDQEARISLDHATKLRRFEYKLTGRLGKRTRFQQHDISQLVVLAKSAATDAPETGNTSVSMIKKQLKADTNVQTQPKDLALDDDTLLERINFSDRNDTHEDTITNDVMPDSLRELDPSDQPLLDPLDSIILLTYASSVTNISPENGLTREEMLPYATRVLIGGSSNWQVYTQALLVRSRIESYTSRTAERGLLQLQALVDQVIVDTSNDEQETKPAASFLPAAKPNENANAAERGAFVFQLSSPMRWELEAELAARWVQLGGLKTALDIYDRLHMWAEAALCLAATEQEDRARALVKKQLFRPSENSDVGDTAIHPPPVDAPRLYCILGDIDQRLEWYETAWRVSKHHYSRAQRSIGKFHMAKREYAKAVDAYTTSLEVNQLDQQTWFALGCALLELKRYSRAVEAFTRCVQLDDSDAESWSNLGAALLRIDTSMAHQYVEYKSGLQEDALDPLSEEEFAATKRQKNLLNALKAFQRASSIKHDSYRIWYNMLVTAASVTPPDFTSVLTAQKRVIDLRASTEGDNCIDVEILQRLVDHIIATTQSYDPSQPGLTRMTVKFIDEIVTPLISSSTKLWHLVSKLSIWRRRPGSALEAEEKAWRITTSQPGWELDKEKAWTAVVDATIRLCDAYESLGPQDKTEGLAAGSGQLVAKDWKYKARSAIKSVLSKARDSWEDSPGWYRLQDAQHNLTA